MQFQKKKWEFQAKQRAERKRLRKEADSIGMSTLAIGRGPSTGLSTFMRQQARSLVDTPWQIIQVSLHMTDIWSQTDSLFYACVNFR